MKREKIFETCIHDLHDSVGGKESPMSSTPTVCIAWHCMAGHGTAWVTH